MQPNWAGMLFVNFLLTHAMVRECIIISKDEMLYTGEVLKAKQAYCDFIGAVLEICEQHELYVRHQLHS